MYCLYTETKREKTINEIKLVSTQQAPYMLNTVLLVISMRIQIASPARVLQILYGHNIS